MTDLQRLCLLLDDLERMRTEMAVRALRAEAQLYLMRIERDHWKGIVERARANKLRPEGAGANDKKRGQHEATDTPDRQ